MIPSGNRDAKLVLANNISATPSTEYVWPGGDGEFSVVATFGGGTVKLQYLGPDGTTWLDAGSNTTLTASGGGIFSLGPGNIRCNIATATGVYAWVRGVS